MYKINMRYEWDEIKNAANIAKHGVDFSQAVDFEWDTAHVVVDDRIDYGETRYCALGYIGMRIHCIVYVIRGETIRIISLRKANRREVQRYAEIKI